MHKFVGGLDKFGAESLMMLRARNFALLGKLTQLNHLKQKSYLMLQEIFNKVEQNQLQRTKNVVNILSTQ